MTIRWLTVISLAALAAASASAREVNCNYTAFLNELDRIAACGSDYSTAGCQPANEHCASVNTLDGGKTATCCSGENAGTCDGGRKITFNCGTTTIYVPNGNDRRDKFCADGTDYDGGECTDDGDCAVGRCETSHVACPDEGAWNVNTTQCTAAHTPWQCCTGNGTGTCCALDGDSSWYLTKHRRDIDYLIIDGRGNITLEMDPPWWHRCDPTTEEWDNCSGQDDKAPNIELELSGDHNIVRDLTFKNWIKALVLSGEYDTADTVTVENTWDFQIGVMQNIANTKEPKEAKINNCTFINSLDKCLETTEPEDAFSYPTMRARITNSTFKACRVGLSIKRGRWHIEGNRFEVDSAVHYSNWQIHGAIHTSDLADHAPVLYLKDNVIDGAGTDPWNIGIHARSNGSIVSLGGNEIRNCSAVGIIAEDQARVFLKNDILENNGGDGQWYGEEGGIAVTGNAIVECGGGNLETDGQTFAGASNNQFVGNSGRSDSTLDFTNSTSTTMYCQNSWWGDTSPSDQVVGSVNYTPPLGEPPDSGGGVLPTPQAVRRTDTHPAGSP